MSRTIDVTIVPVVRLIFYVCRVDSDTTSTLLRRFVDVAVVSELRASTFRKDLSDSSSQRSLAVIDVSYGIVDIGDGTTTSEKIHTDGTNVHVRLSTGELRTSSLRVPSLEACETISQMHTVLLCTTYTS